VGPDNQAYLTAFGLERLDPAGTAFTPIPVPAGLGTPEDVAVDAQGRVLVVGTNTQNGGSAATAVARFDASLALDPSFGTGGLARLPPLQALGRSAGPLLLADPGGGATVVEYTVSTRGTFYVDLAIRCLLDDGSGDTGFSQDGLAQSAFANGGPGIGVSDAALLGTDVLVSGGKPSPAGDLDAYVVRINGHAPERSLPAGVTQPPARSLPRPLIHHPWPHRLSASRARRWPGPRRMFPL
jgi:hypothetical protein